MLAPSWGVLWQKSKRFMIGKLSLRQLILGFFLAATANASDVLAMQEIDTPKVKEKKDDKKQKSSATIADSKTMISVGKEQKKADDKSQDNVDLEKGTETDLQSASASKKDAKDKEKSVSADVKKIDEQFVPTEEISEDLSVSFPVDI